MDVIGVLFDLSEMAAELQWGCRAQEREEEKMHDSFLPRLAAKRKRGSRPSPLTRMADALSRHSMNVRACQSIHKKCVLRIRLLMQAPGLDRCCSALMAQQFEFRDGKCSTRQPCKLFFGGE